MQLPGALSLFFLTYLLVLFPLGALRTARVMRGADPKRPPPSRMQYWRSGLLFQLILFAFAWFTGRDFGYRIFALEGLESLDLLWAALAFGVCLGLRLAVRMTRSPEELKELAVYKRAPRTRQERALYALVVLAASVAEEAAYRGVGWSILWYSLGDPWSSALIASAAFALAHWGQGWKSGATIFAIALVLHGLVALTGTLLLAMVVHAAYDLVVGRAIRLEAQKMALEGRIDGDRAPGEARG